MVSALSLALWLWVSECPCRSGPCAVFDSLHAMASCASDDVNTTPTPRPCPALSTNQDISSSYDSEPIELSTMNLRTSHRDLFLSLPVELRDQIYGYMLDSVSLPPDCTRIELSNVRHFTGTPVSICLTLRWTFFLLSRQIAAEGVAHAFKFHRVRIVAGPWVARRWLEKIEETSKWDLGTGILEATDIDETPKSWEEPPPFNAPSRGPLLSHLLSSFSQSALQTGKTPLPWTRSTWGWGYSWAPFISHHLRSGREILSWLRTLELDWRTLPHDIELPGTHFRLCKYELRPFFLYLATRCPNLTHLVLPLHFRSSRGRGHIGPSEWYFITLASIALACMLRGCPWSRITIRYQPLHAWASLQPAFSMTSLLKDGLWAMLQRGELREVQQVIWGAGALYQECGEEDLDVRLTHVRWDPMEMLHMDGDEVEIELSLKHAEVRSDTPPRRLSDILECNDGPWEEDSEGRVYPLADTFEKWKRETAVQWEGLREEQVYGLFLSEQYGRHGSGELNQLHVSELNRIREAAIEESSWK